MKGCPRRDSTGNTVNQRTHALENRQTAGANGASIRSTAEFRISGMGQRPERTEWTGSEWVLSISNRLRHVQSKRRICA